MYNDRIFGSAGATSHGSLNRNFGCCTAMTQSQSDLKTAIQDHKAGRIAEAEAGYRAVLEADPNNADALHLLGLVAHQSGDNEAALRLISQAISVNGKSAVYQCNLGGVFRAMMKPEKAMEVLTEALRLDPDHADSRYNLGLVLSDLGKPQDAISEFQRAIDNSPGHAAAHGALADTLASFGNYKAAIESYKDCLRLDPSNSAAQYNLGNAYLVMSEPAEAAGCYQKNHRAAAGLCAGAQ